MNRLLICLVSLCGLQLLAQEPLRVDDITIFPINCTGEAPTTGEVALTIAGGIKPYKVVVEDGVGDVSLRAGTDNVFEIEGIPGGALGTPTIFVGDAENEPDQSGVFVDVDVTVSSLTQIGIDLLPVGCPEGTSISFRGMSVLVRGLQTVVLVKEGEEIDRKSFDDGNIDEPFTGLPAGQYTMNFTPSSSTTAGCNDTQVITFQIPAFPLSFTSITTTPSNNSDDGTMKIAIKGGNPGFGYTITGPKDPTPIGIFERNAEFSDLPAGQYTVDVIDSTGCEISAQVTVDVFASRIANRIAVASCGLGG